MLSRDREHGAKPRWSVVIPVHNCARFLAVALPEVVDQLGGRDDAEIIVVDDASADDPRSVVEALGKGCVRYERNAGNLGAIRTFNRCIALSRGQIVHLLHGDDIVRPGFYAEMERGLDGSPALMAMCRTHDIDQDGVRMAQSRRYRRGTGVWANAFPALAVSNRVRAPGIVVRRSAYEEWGVFRTDLPHAADWELWTRMASRGPVVFVDEILAGYRKHGASDSARRLVTGSNIRERVTAIGIISEHVPAAARRATTRKALLYSVLYAGRSAVVVARRGQWRAAVVQGREALRCLALAPRGVPAASVIRSGPERSGDL